MVVTSRLGFCADVDSKEFQASCFSLAKEIDGVIGKNGALQSATELAVTLKNLCRRKCSLQTKGAIITVMVSAKIACQLGLFPQRETEELLALINPMWNCFNHPENVIPSVDTTVDLLIQVMQRFYPFVNLGYIILSCEAEPGSNILAKEFHISKNMKMSNSVKERIGLLVFQTEDISKSSCIVHPQEVSFLLNGRCVEKRANISMDSGPQPPTNVTALVNQGANVLQAIGRSGGIYMVVIAFINDKPLPDKPLLKDYVRSEVIESNPDCDIIEGASRISLNCPISRTRIKLPVKGHVCKHLQCFDFWNYVNMNKRRPSWRCPHCNQSVCYTDIRADQNMIKILEEVGCNVADVVISADGSWRVVAESDENVELVPETVHDHGDPQSIVNLGPTVLDLTRNENSGMQVDEQKPCVADIQGPSNETHNPAADYTMLNQSSAAINALPQLPEAFTNFDGQQGMNLPEVPNTRDSAARQATTFLPTSFSQDTLAASLHTSMPPAQSFQFQGSHIPSLQHCVARTPDLIDRWNHIYGSGIDPTPLPQSPPLRYLYGMQNQRPPIRSMLPARRRPMPSSQPLAVNYRGTPYERQVLGRPVHRGNPYYQRPVLGPNPGGATEQFPSQDLMNMTPADTSIWRPQSRMRGSVTPGSGYDHMIIQPTTVVQGQAQTNPPLQSTGYNYYLPDEHQAGANVPHYMRGYMH